MKHKSSAQFMSKMISYQGLLVFLPYMAINMLKLAQNPLTINNSFGIIIFLLILFGVMILLDVIGMKTKLLDIHSRKITTILGFIGAGFIIYLFILIRNGWNNANPAVVSVVYTILTIYMFIGWFYIRSSKTNRPSKEDKMLRSSAHCFASVALVWALGHFIDDFAILAGLLITMVIYPIVVYIGDKRMTESEENIIKPDKLAKRETLMGVTDFLWDFIKVVVLIATIIVFSYNGDIVLFPISGLFSHSIYWGNLMWLAAFAALTAIIFEQLENRLYGKFLVTLVLIAALGQWIFSILGYSDQWLMITTLNGITIAGVFTFTEQKIAKSGNIGVLPGMMFFLIFLTQLGALFLNNLSNVVIYINWIRLVLSVGGLFFVYFKIKYFPDKQGVKYSPLGIRYYDVPEDNHSSSNVA